MSDIVKPRTVYNLKKVPHMEKEYQYPLFPFCSMRMKITKDVSHVSAGLSQDLQNRKYVLFRPNWEMELLTVPYGFEINRLVMYAAAILRIEAPRVTVRVYTKTEYQDLRIGAKRRCLNTVIRGKEDKGSVPVIFIYDKRFMLPRFDVSNPFINPAHTIFDEPVNSDKRKNVSAVGLIPGRNCAIS